MLTLAPWYLKQREQPINNMLAHHFPAFTNNANDKMTHNKLAETECICAIWTENLQELLNKSASLSSTPGLHPTCS